ncbi:thaumatin [Rhodocollybia butyracea]|uniref:Thaumatin n=1 Tax=Rhodocollybia butyracea TaxID=206335 RepID=A0A9P5PTZ7_9AGAR|nr:thaumatin [Rhodocollybia butyracea]
MSFTSLLALALAAVSVAGQSLNVVNNCGESLFLFTQTSFGTIDTNVIVNAGTTTSLGISSNWDGAVNVGTGCDSTGQTCTTGGPAWDGTTPMSRAEFNFFAIPGQVTYDISLIYGFNVGMEISTGDSSCFAFSCGSALPAGCPVPGPAGPQGNTCFSPCCSSAAACAGGALPAGGGGCVDNAGPGPQSPYYDATCPNAYAFPDNDGAAGFTPADEVDFTCDNTAVVLTLCPSGSSDFPK